MKRGVVKVTACCLAGSVIFASTGLTAFAAGEMPLAGIGAEIIASQEKKENSETKKVIATGYDSLVIAQFDEYVNIRDEASTETGQIVGKLYNNSAAEIIGQTGDWYLIKSGDVTGYVSKDYFVTGAQAEELAAEVGDDVATVNTETLMVRKKASTDSDVIALVGDSQQLQVIDQEDGWVKVAVDNDVVGYVSSDRVMENYGKAAADIQNIINIIRTAPAPEIPVSSSKVNFTCNVTQEEYCKLVEKTKEYIIDGDIFQAVISRQFSTPYEGSLINPYRVLRTTNPSPYMVYLSIDGEEIMSTSPETLVRLENGRLTTFPVAGSRPRGTTPEEDKVLEKDLLSDEKELSEHNMLVDLGRNDLGKISNFDSVEVTKYMMIHRYSKIMHICSQVESNIRSDCDGLSAIESVLPAGTLSGAPKIRACEIIEELESEQRGIYGGALGYLDFTGNLDTCIAIRMAVKKDGHVYVQAGGGIVADSIPENEYMESYNKALAVMNAVKNAKEVLE